MVAEAVDAGLVAGLLVDFNTEFDTPVPPLTVLTARFGQLLSRPDVLVLLARDGDGQATGFALLTTRPTPYYDGPLGQLEELYVRPALRGRGIGSALIGGAITRLVEQGCGELHINVDEIDLDTRRFYERHGFVTIEPGTDYRMLCYLRVLGQ